MNPILITDQKKLNEFAGGQAHAVFQQSWEWGEFQRAAGFPVFRIGVEDGGRLVAAATIVKRPLPLGRSYFYCPNGAVMESGEWGVGSGKRNSGSGELGAGSGLVNAWELLLKQIRILAVEEKAVFFRFEPGWELYNQLTTHHSPLTRTIDVQPSKTSIVNLDGIEEEILIRMHQKTRYNIRLAEKKGLDIVELGEGGFEEFWRLMEETRTRDGFRLHGKEYYRRMIGIGGALGAESAEDKMLLDSRLRGNDTRDKTSLSIKLIGARWQGRLVAANIVVWFGDTATYVHGASSSSDRNLMAPYLLQWHSIKLAKQAGCRYYDLYGADEKKWPGVTRFKRGFGGVGTEKPGTYDLVFSGWQYEAYKAMRRLRRAAG